MTNDDNPSDSVFIAMQAFSSIAEATEFTANEVALFYALLQSWNSARRPAVVEQWAKTTSWKSGIKDQKALVRARNTLIQKGVIFYEKRGNRCIPRYSLNALFGRTPPDGLLVNTASKEACKVTVNSPVKSHSYQEEEKDKQKPPTPTGGKEGNKDLETRFVEKWNSLPSPIRKIRDKIPKHNKKHFLARCKDDDWLTDWETAIDAMATDPHCLGDNDRAWIATLDYFLRPNTVEKLLSRKGGRDLKKKKETQPKVRIV